MKVKLFLWIDYDPISVLYQIQSDMSTNSRAIKYQSIEKSLSLIIERLISMAKKKITRPIFTKFFCHGPWTRIHQLAQNQNDRTSIVACTSFEDRMQTKKTHRQHTLKNRRFCKVITLNDIGSSWNLAQPFPLGSVPPPIFFNFFGIYLTILELLIDLRWDFTR